MGRLLASSLVLVLAGPAFADPPASDNDAPPPVRLHGANSPVELSPSPSPTPTSGPATRGHRGGGRHTAATTTPGGTFVPPLTVVGGDMPAEGGRAPHAEGTYGGVAPDQPHPTDPTRPTKAKRPSPKGTLTWIGFEAKDGGAEVFFQSVAPFVVTQTLEGGTLVVMLSGLTRQVTNTRRPIDTRFFDNPLATITAHAVGAARATKTRPAHSAGIEVRIAFKNPKDAREAAVRTATEADGMYYSYLSFPEGAEPATAAPTMQDPEK